MKNYKKILLLFPIIFLFGFGLVQYCTTQIVEEVIWIGETTINYHIVSVNLNDTEATECEVFFVEVIESCQKEGSLEIDNAGTYQITYTAIFTDRREIASVQFLVLSEYYSSAAGKYGNDLLLELRSIMNDTMVRLEYGDARDILQESDRDPNNPNNLITFYRQESVLST
jgi:hypothetical protein